MILEIFIYQISNQFHNESLQFLPSMTHEQFQSLSENVFSLISY